MKDFAGVRACSIDNWDMIKRALLAVLGSVALSLPIAAQEFDGSSSFALDPSGIFDTVDSATLVAGLPMWTFLDGRLPGTNELGRMRQPNVDLTVGESSSYSMAQIVVHANIRKNSDPKDGKDSSVETLPLQSASNLYTGGEIGFMYGHATGKFGGDLFSSYIVGEIGDDKVHINVGASYDEFHGRVPRWRP